VDLFGPAWGEGLPGGLAAGRRAAFSVNTLTRPGDRSLLLDLGADTDLNKAEVQARTMLLALMTSTGCPCVSAATLSRRVSLPSGQGAAYAVWPDWRQPCLQLHLLPAR
jgi:isoamylase